MQWVWWRRNNNICYNIPAVPDIGDGLVFGWLDSTAWLIPYYFRVTAENEMGPDPSVFTVPPFAIPFPNVPAEPSFLSSRSTDSSSIALEIGSPEQRNTNHYY